MASMVRKKPRIPCVANAPFDNNITERRLTRWVAHATTKPQNDKDSIAESLGKRFRINTAPPCETWLIGRNANVDNEDSDS
jgi:hypothetical protein